MLKNKLYFYVIISSLIITTYFFLQIFYIYEVDTFYLSFSLPTDPKYNLLNNQFFSLIGEKLNFPWILFLIDAVVIKSIKFNNFWILLVLNKIVQFIIIFYFINKLYELNSNKKTILSLVVILFVISDIDLFSYRYPSPLNTSWLFFIIFYMNILILKNQNWIKNNFFVFWFSAVYALCLQLLPFAINFLFIMSIFVIRGKIIELLKNKIVYIGFFLFISLHLINLSNNFFNDTSHSKYLGITFIQDRFSYIFSYYMNTLFSIKFWTYFFLIGVLNFFSKNYKLLIILIISLFFAPLINILFGIELLAWHQYKIQNFQFASLVLLFSICEFIFTKKNIFNFILVTIMFFSVIIYKQSNNQFDNNLFERARWIEENYSKTFQQLSKYPKNCKLFTNNHYIEAYWSGILGRKSYIANAFFRSEKFENIEREFLKVSPVLNNVFKLNYDDFKKIITHKSNFYLRANAYYLNKYDFSIIDKLKNNNKKDYMKIIYVYDKNFFNTDLPELLIFNNCNK